MNLDETLIQIKNLSPEILAVTALYPLPKLLLMVSLPMFVLIATMEQGFNLLTLMAFGFIIALNAMILLIT